MGSTRPYYRRWRPAPQKETEFLRDMGLRWMVGRLEGSGALPPQAHRSIRGVLLFFPPATAGSARGLLANMLIWGGISPHIDLDSVHLESYDVADPLSATRLQFDKRAAAVVFASVSPHLGVRMAPKIRWEAIDPPHFVGKPWPFRVDDVTGTIHDGAGQALSSVRALLEMKFYGDAAPTVWHPTDKSLAAMAFADYFPGPQGDQLRLMVSSALLAAAPGWSGTIGPDVGTFDLLGKPKEGNYDIAQQHLLRTAYAYFEELQPSAREHLIRALLARGRIHRVNLKDTFTSGRVPNDWSRSGFVSPAGVHKRVGETENHILMIQTARYLSNQLLYQRQPRIAYDNRRNGSGDAPSCMELLLFLLRNILLDDFSEYNAKSYQHESRTALLNLCNFAYDHEVRLAARMVLDYVAAHMAVSGNDCRRMVPFRRRNEGKNSTRTADGHMTVGLLEWQRGADPLTEHMAMHTGTNRAYRVPTEPVRPLPWSIASSGGDATYEMLSGYRMPTPIQDLFVNELHRRFFQVLNRRELGDPEVTGRDANNSELFAGSPSYLITAGGATAGFAIDPYFVFYLPSGQDSQRGVALPSSFMPTGESAGNNPADPDRATEGYATHAANLIQVGRFMDRGPGRNYGVAPDFLCGPYLSLPRWCLNAIIVQRRGKFDFVNKGGLPGRPGFYLAILRDGDLAVIEAFDTWLHPDLTFDQFRANVWSRNKGLSASGLREFDEQVYTMENGNRIHFSMWGEQEEDEPTQSGAEIISIEWSGADPNDRLPDVDGYRFLKGTVLNSTGDGLVRLTNPFLGQAITLDMRDEKRPRRTSELNDIEAAGDHQEVWLDFDWAGIDPSEGDFFRPFRTMGTAVAAVASHGVIKIVPGATMERGNLNRGKRLRLSAPIGGVTIGSRPPS
jgi:hypothetical protein